MTDPTMALLEYLRDQGLELNGDFLREEAPELYR